MDCIHPVKDSEKQESKLVSFLITFKTILQMIKLN